MRLRMLTTLMAKDLPHSLVGFQGMKLRMKVMMTLMVIVTSTLIGDVTSNEAEEESDDSAEGK